MLFFDLVRMGLRNRPVLIRALIKGFVSCVWRHQLLSGFYLWLTLIKVSFELPYPVLLFSQSQNYLTLREERVLALF